MKRDGNYWVDPNNNRWNIDRYTKQESAIHSAGLIGCTDCTDCVDCVGCKYCADCKYCTRCVGCKYCTDCVDCVGCKYCADCKYCTDCVDCKYCADCKYCTRCVGCKYCTDCVDCVGCTDWQETPFTYRVPGMGSTGRYVLQAVFDSERSEIDCGCFRGSLAEAKKEIDSRPADYEPRAAFLKQFAIIEKLQDEIST